MMLSFIMIKPFKPQPSVDGMKPIAESMPRYKEMPMTEARPSAPDHAKTAGMSDFDDDLPPFQEKLWTKKIYKNKKNIFNVNVEKLGLLLRHLEKKQKLYKMLTKNIEI